MCGARHRLISWSARADTRDDIWSTESDDALVLLVLSDLVDLIVAEAFLMLERGAGLGWWGGRDGADARRPRGRGAEVALCGGHGGAWGTCSGALEGCVLESRSGEQA